MVPDGTRRDAVMWDCLKQLDELENQTVPKLVFSQTTVQFDAPMAYGEPAVQFVTLPTRASCRPASSLSQATR